MPFSPRCILDLKTRPLIGMIHLPPFNNPYQELLEFSLKEAEILNDAEFDAILVENFHDIPYNKTRIADEKFLIMGLIVNEIVSRYDIPCGVNILRNACTQALIIATITHSSFIRCNIYEGVYVTDQGLIEGVAFELQKKKQELQATVKILADVHVKHATPLGQFSLVESAKNVLNRGSADAIIVSGKETGKMIDYNELRILVETTGIKPVLGSGLTINNLKTVYPFISGAIVGSSIKANIKDLSSPIDPIRAKSISKAWKKEKRN